MLLEGSSKSDELANRVAKSNPKVYNGKYDPELEEYIKGMKKIFAVMEVLDEKK